MNSQIQSIEEMIKGKVDQKFINVAFIDTMALMADRIEQLERQLAQLQQPKGEASGNPFNIG